VGLSILLAFVALLSSLIPALCAARVSPVRALREE
jgi:ABC-type lipoprotein release transport system permease subunit